MKKYSFNIVLSLLVIVLSTSCSQQKHIAYYQNIEQLGELSSTGYESTIQPDDLLMIIVSAPDSEAAAPFNLEVANMSTANGQASLGQRQQQLYLVDKNGMVEFPVLGSLPFGGKTKEEIVTLLKEKLKLYIKNAIVNMRIMNYKVSVLGEVSRPGSYPINSERITLPEALSLAGDLTIYGKREGIIIVREVNGKKTFNKVDITKADFINSPFYYLSQNDLVYVEPNKARSNSSTFNQNTTVWIAIASLASSVLFSILLINKN